MPSTSAYLRFPHLAGELLVFCAADDVWLAPLAGGRAWRLTADATPVSRPRFSPDGGRVAWISTRDGHAEVMVADVDGGSADRLTWLGSAATIVLGWTGDGRVLIATDAHEGPRRRAMVHAVALDGTVEQLRHGAASGLAVHPGGAVALSTPMSRPPAHWKRYRGGTAPRLWLDRAGDGSWERLLPDVDAGLVSPNWIGDTLVFASDQGATFPDHADGQANLWALDALGSGEPTQVTHHGTAEGYVRDPAGDGERIVYHARGVLYLLTGLDATPTALDVTLGGALATRRSRALAPTERLNEVRPDQGGDASVVEWRGKVFHLAHREGPARAVVADSGVRARLPRLLGRSGSAIVVSDAGGADRLEIHDLTGATAVRIVDADVGRVVGLEASPAGDVAIALSRDGRVHHVDVASAQTREVARSAEGEVASVAFSPDGRYVVWAQPTRLEQLHQLVGLDLSRDDAEPVTLTSGRFADTSPSFSRDGKHLLFLSARTFDPSYDQHSFDLSFVAAVRPYLVPLTATEAAPFGPSAEGWRISAPDAPPADGSAPGTTADGNGEGGVR